MGRKSLAAPWPWRLAIHLQGKLHRLAPAAVDNAESQNARTCTRLNEDDRATPTLVARAVFDLVPCIPLGCGEGAP